LETGASEEDCCKVKSKLNKQYRNKVSYLSQRIDYLQQEQVELLEKYIGLRTIIGNKEEYKLLMVASKLKEKDTLANPKEWLK